jgi:hypothetical protein
LRSGAGTCSGEEKRLGEQFDRSAAKNEHEEKYAQDRKPSGGRIPAREKTESDREPKAPCDEETTTKTKSLLQMRETSASHRSMSPRVGKAERKNHEIQNKNEDEPEEQNRATQIQQNQKGTTNSTSEIQKSIFSFKSNKITTESRRSPSSLPHLIIKNKNRVLGTLAII